MKRWLVFLVATWLYDSWVKTTDGISLSGYTEKLDKRPILRVLCAVGLLWMADHLVGTRKIPFVPLVDLSVVVKTMKELKDGL